MYGILAAMMCRLLELSRKFGFQLFNLCMVVNLHY